MIRFIMCTAHLRRIKTIHTSLVWSENGTFCRCIAKNEPIFDNQTSTLRDLHRHLMSDNREDDVLDCASLYNRPDRQKYEDCTQMMKDEGFDFVDPWYFSNVPVPPNTFVIIQYDDTFVIIQSDHGIMKGLLYEQGSRVPQFLRYPPLFNKKGTRDSALIMPQDFITSNFQTSMSWKHSICYAK